MNIILIMQNSLEAAKKAIKTSNIESNEEVNWWFWLVIIQFVIILYLIFKPKLTKKQSLKQKLKKESLDNQIDFDNIINSSFNSNEVYDKLKIKCHPDRFPNDKEKNTIAENLFQEITKNKDNIKRLLELKEKAKEELNINF
ncbi:DnaJ superfamily protein [Psychroflexus torquis ATCC 700755]|uniref:DnaJ superfamily protein n=1 Tax=Psychroflexus torquis (strain ATCC 700755 / CIP 106069 / ACAM 623) TaxID=313595 RepID=K4IUJ5_PSYTT|nr:hypothetical protein [Psychroflexus torquis]AFU69140.1 DnaJ superfamily protein [Psychroflexus torquis ATCC 700755]